ncbi:MAG: FecR domain-containing protein [Sphingobacterium sp.]|jgi:hypothetical protein|nr:FecR domain-containing protein [Sphingobacterium sp.]
MDDKNGHIGSLIDKFERGLATDEDIRKLEVWFQSFESNPNITDRLTTEQQQKAKLKLFQQINTNIDTELTKRQVSLQRRSLSTWTRYMIAASVLIVSSFGVYLLLNKNFEGTPIVANTVEDFAPGSDKAILTLSSGQQVKLDDAQRGQLATQGNTSIRKSAEGTVVYDQDGLEQTEVRNTLSTPRGGKYHLVLADGTRAWLNAASSITYPASFNGTFREVEITGEVYFEVAHHADRPFRVKTGKQLVEVLGTHFNINAYATEGIIKTTLLEGSVAINSAGGRKLLRPGQQAVLTGNAIGVNGVDVNEAVAWKEGYFDFTDADIQTVMQEFSRWYDLDIVFDGPQTKETFTGRIPRSWSFARVMKIMETFKSTHFTLKGRRVMVIQF